MHRRILHVDLDAFFASVEQALDPSLEGKPVVVGGKPGGRGVVSSASYEARVFGIRSAMPLSRAYRLCPQAVFVDGHFSYYRIASQRFMSILDDYSPHVEPGGIDEAYVDLTGSEALFGPAHGVAQRIRERVWDELRITASVGLSTSKVVSKVASDLDKPDGLVEVMPGEEAAFLAPLPVRRLPGVGPKTEQVLKGVGVAAIGDLAALSPSYLCCLFGKTGALLGSWARGEDGSPVEERGEARSISRCATLSRDTLDRPFLLGMLRYLSEKVGAELRRMEKRARVVALKVRYADFETLTRQCRLRGPTDIDQLIFGAVAELLQRQLAGAAKLVRLVGVEVSGLQAEAQLRLLPSVEDRLERLDRALDGLRLRYGYDAVQTGRTLAVQRRAGVFS
ncbi:MAG: DNA polymerase IV [Chloroflexi bacterium]|nr:DNA polymerase IV [Chloroflexota bacterium]